MALRVRSSRFSWHHLTSSSNVASHCSRASSTLPCNLLHVRAPASAAAIRCRRRCRRCSACSVCSRSAVVFVFLLVHGPCLFVYKFHPCIQSSSLRSRSHHVASYIATSLYWHSKWIDRRLLDCHHQCHCRCHRISPIAMASHRLPRSAFTPLDGSPSHITVCPPARAFSILNPRSR